MITSAKFLSRRDAEKIAYYGPPPAGAVSLVSIVSVDARPIDLTPRGLPSAWHRVLYLEFDDVDASSGGAWQAIPYVPITAEQAGRVLDFLLEVQDQSTEVWAHCEAGISRSAAVVKYVADVYRLERVVEYMNGYMLHNRYVYSLLHRVHRERAERGEPVPGVLIEFDGLSF